jgi:hypothetical protein
MKWINVNTRLPDKNGWYLVYRPYMTIQIIAMSFYDRIWDSHGIYITHWMPLPKPPIINKYKKRKK